MANTVVSVPSLPLFGLKTRRTVRYEESVALTGSAGNVYGYVFSANGCYDPNVTGTGHQPMGFDQMMLLYDHYTVANARLKLHAMNTHATQVCKIGVLVSGDPAGYSTNYQANIETGQMVYATLSPNGAVNSMASFTQKADIAALSGTQQVLDSHDLRGDAASNPAEQTYFIVLIWNPQNATVPTALLDVIIEYDVVFTEPRLGSQSLRLKDVTSVESKRK